MRMVRFWRSTWLVQVLAGSGLPLTGTFSALVTSGGLYRRWPNGDERDRGATDRRLDRQWHVFIDLRHQHGRPHRRGQRAVDYRRDAALRGAGGRVYAPPGGHGFSQCLAGRRRGRGGYRGGGRRDTGGGA